MSIISVPDKLSTHRAQLFCVITANVKIALEFRGCAYDYEAMRSNGKKESERGQKTLAGSFAKALKSFSTSLPLLLGVILLLGLFRVFVTNAMISSVFTGAVVRDTVIGAVIGSVSAGNPIVSYIIGGELLAAKVSLFAVAAFIVAWVTVGVVQFPAEAAILGRRFATARNVLSFIFAIALAIVTVATVGVLT